jgi:DNA-directed RNA polymerase subunit M/transcription elongation factor TFIIS
MKTESITCMALGTWDEAEKQRLTFLDPDCYGLLCLWKSHDDQLWAVVTRQVMDAFEEKACPECGCREYSVHNTLVAGIETTYRSCPDCHHRWRFE